MHQYRGYEILCSLAGYTVMQGGIEVLSIGTADAGTELADCSEVDHMLRHAEQAIDRLIAEAAP
ncbi:hypothetical protein VI08_15200 [Luteibacter yeojuensis]|uniref:Uncharacterized protein n=1 Tax=Luteibacter yeojuensis TaxID=345309 RepID=A0A0F3KH43_9GAMM|nr:hypothetical protein VI08_15200 [Luteibacter yeojuensis]